MSDPVIGFAGMTHLGLLSATSAASKGFRVVGYDPDAALAARLTQGDFPLFELGLTELHEANGARQSFTADLADLAACDLVYISADVPTDDQGSSDLSGIRVLIEQVCSAMAPTALLVVLCQVPPGFTRALPLPPKRLYYQVETLVFGIAVERATKPERFIVGCANPAEPLPENFATFLHAFGCPILPMRYESAELAKISINMCLVASVTVANTLAELCESTGAAWDEIVPALKLDRRIGAYSYLAPGLGIAGGNLERDLATVKRLAEASGGDSGLVTAMLGNSRHRRDWATKVLRGENLPSDPLIAILGLAYKENTRSVKNSPSLATIAQLGEYRLRLHDPEVPASIVTHPRAEAAATPLDAAEGADVVMILTPWPLYRALDPAALAGRMRGRLVIDPYAVLDAAKAKAAGLDHRVLGRGATPTAASAKS